MKELEKNTSQHITTLEREKAVIEEKLQNFERKMQDENRQKEKEIFELKERIEQSGVKLNGNISILEDEISNYKLRIAELERRESDLIA